jgi:hypothetical protein
MNDNVSAIRPPSEPAREPRLPVRAVRIAGCGLCQAPPGQPCQIHPPGDHLSRWLSAYQAGHISRDDLALVFSHLVVVTKWQLVRSAA